jgi:hypothetical protein
MLAPDFINCHFFRRNYSEAVINEKMRLWALILPVLLYEARGLRDSRAQQQQQQQQTFNIVGDVSGYSSSSRHKRNSDPATDTE